MLARIRKSMEEKDQGFTLIELLVVMIIIGILAAIAIPVFLNQQKKANDTATKSDVASMGKELAAYYVDGTGTVSVTQTGQSVKVGAADAMKLSDGTKLGTVRTNSAQDWCVSASNPTPKGTGTSYEYSATGGLAKGDCAAVTP